MGNRWQLSSAVVGLLLVAAAHAQEEPRDTGLIEQATSRLAQIDVTVSGPLETITALEPEDFVLKINLTKITDFRLDRFCDVAHLDQADASPEDADELPTASGPAANFLFYFDQPHLTLAGRQRSLDQARRLVPLLIRDGSQGMIVSNARGLALLQEFTDDADALLDALDRLEHDRRQWDTFAEDEAARVADVVDSLGRGAMDRGSNLDRAANIARVHQRDEQFRTGKSLRRLSLTLNRLAALRPPKAVLYFADTMRSNPGAHYLSFFGNRTVQQAQSRDLLHAGGFAAGLPFDEVVNGAAAEGIRFYTVRAAGMVTPFDRTAPGSGGVESSGATPASSWVRYRDAQQTLQNLAAETGGRAFVNGAAPHKIARRILEDFACMYVLSFDPSEFAEDAPLRAVVKMRADDVKIRVRGRLVVHSEAKRLANRLQSAFSLGGAGGSDLGLRATLVPTGFARGSYSALLQISVPRSRLATATWDLGVSLVSREKVQQEISGRLSVLRAGIPVILEQEVEIRPRPYEIVAVAHETATDFILSERAEVAWPDPDDHEATCGPISLLQPTDGAFSRDGVTRTEGAVTIPEGEPVEIDLPTVAVGLVCRDRRHRGTLRVEHWLERDTRVEFDPLNLELGDERCAQIRDMIPPDQLQPGSYRYGLRVSREGRVLDEVIRTFDAVGPG